MERKHCLSRDARRVRERYDQTDTRVLKSISSRSINIHVDWFDLNCQPAGRKRGCPSFIQKGTYPFETNFVEFKVLRGLISARQYSLQPIRALTLALAMLGKARLHLPVRFSRHDLCLTQLLYFFSPAFYMLKVVELFQSLFSPPPKPSVLCAANHSPRAGAERLRGRGLME